MKVGQKYFNKKGLEHEVIAIFPTNNLYKVLTVYKSVDDELESEWFTESGKFIMEEECKSVLDLIIPESIFSKGNVIANDNITVLITGDKVINNSINGVVVNIDPDGDWGYVGEIGETQSIFCRTKDTESREKDIYRLIFKATK